MMTSSLKLIIVDKFDQIQISWFTAWLSLDEARIQKGRNRCYPHHHFRHQSSSLATLGHHFFVKFVIIFPLVIIYIQRIHIIIIVNPQHSALHNCVRKRRGQIRDKTAMGQVIFHSNRVSIPPLFLTFPVPSCYHFIAQNILKTTSQH